MKYFILTILLLSIPVYAQAARLLNEAHYQNEWCQKWNGQAEYQLSDLTRVDCLTAAVEFDFAKKMGREACRVHYIRSGCCQVHQRANH